MKIDAILGTRAAALALLALCAAWFAAPTTGLGASPPGDPLAVISSYSGDVRVRAGASAPEQPASLGQPLFGGETVLTGPDSTAALLFTAGGSLKIYPDSSFALDERSPEKKSGLAGLSAALWEGVSGLFSARDERETLTVVGGIRRRRGDVRALDVIYPRNTAITEARPTFLWRYSGAPGSAAITLSLKGVAGTLWEHSSDQGELAYPADAPPLTPGVPYFLKIADSKVPALGEEVFFQLADPEVLAEVAELKSRLEAEAKGDPNDHSRHLVLGQFLLARGLLQGALEEFQALEKAYPEERFPLVKQIEVLTLMDLKPELVAVRERLESLKPR